MSVGFENSGLKMSFSLSSLQPPGSHDSPEQARLQVERPYNSLNKKSRRTLEREMWRRSWGTQQEKKDEFWAALQPNYNYLMDNNLIESCKEASGELSCDEEDVTATHWSFKDFAAQFSELCSWLNSICEAVYGKEENVGDMNLRLEHLEAMKRKSYRRKLFSEQADRLVIQHANLQEEVKWRVDYLNSKWEMLEQSISPSKQKPYQNSLSTAVEHEARCLKEWIHEMEQHLKPLKMQIVASWDLAELEEKVAENEVLYQDIRAHGKVVAAVLRRAGLADKASQKLAKRLERRWQLLFLRSLEWQSHLESLLKRSKYPCLAYNGSDSDEEPVTKHPRLSNTSDQLTDDGSYFEDDIQDICVMDTSPACVTSNTSIVLSSPDIEQKENKLANMVGTNISSLQTARQDHSANTHNYKSEVVKRASRSKDDKAAAGYRRRSAPADTHSLGKECEESKFNRSNRKSWNCATFYFRHLDTDSEHDASHERLPFQLPSLQSSSNEVKSVDVSSDDEWTYTGQEKGCELQDGRMNSLDSSSETASMNARKSKAVVRLDFSDNTIGPIKEDCTITKDYEICLNEELDICKMISRDGPKNTKKGTVNQENIQFLVNQAEELVREDSVNSSVHANCVFQPMPLEIGQGLPQGQSKRTCIKQWLKMHTSGAGIVSQDGKFQLPDSCDASGEYTTGDSDEDMLSEFSDEYNGSVLICKQYDSILNQSSPSHSAEVIADSDATPTVEKKQFIPSSSEQSNGKVVLRSKRRSVRGDRPWSMSGITQLSQNNARPLAQFSTSESALHQMLSPSNVSIGTQANLSSSTINEPLHSTHDGHGSTTGSLRRRKARPRKKSVINTGRKSESGSEGMTVGLSGSSDTPQLSSSPNHKSSISGHGKCRNSSGTDGGTKSNTPVAHSLVKSGSFSGTASASRKVPERYSASDPSAVPHRQNSLSFDTSETGTETDEEAKGKLCSLPVFRLGPDQGSVTINVGLTLSTELLRDTDSDVEKVAHNAEEQLSSFSEQAWDNYQEKYMSEPYSEELADSETARRLLEFGDDYRNFLDSHSDCASSLEAHKDLNISSRRRKPAVFAVDSLLLDSDSDLEDIHHLIRQSQSHYDFSEHVLNKRLSKASPELLLSADFAEIIATCRENKRCLDVILDNVEEEELLSVKDCKEIRCLLEKWDALQSQAEELQRVRALQREMGTLRDELLDLATRVATVGSNLNDRSQLEMKIQQMKAELSSLMERKKQMLQLNLAVHRLVTEPGSPASFSSTSPGSRWPSPLKDDVADMYRVWNDTFHSVASRLSRLERAAMTWRTFEAHLSELQMALRGDHDTLNFLRAALEEGAPSAVADVATSVRDVARLLSETPAPVHPGTKDLANTVSALSSASVCSISSQEGVLMAEGSLSDSGISDSGSEQELSERARRLAALRRLARHLQAELVPGGSAPGEVDIRIEQLENVLRELQDSCRDLIARTAAFVEARSQTTLSVSATDDCKESAGDRTAELPVPSIRTTRRHSKSRRYCAKVSAGGGAGDPDDDGHGKHQRPWLWRVMRAALPFQLALVAVLCMACLLEPHCCDAFNSLGLSLTPQLRYVRGPPPV